jgi:hypothetical protein
MKSIQDNIRQRVNQSTRFFITNKDILSADKIGDIIAGYKNDLQLLLGEQEIDNDFIQSTQSDFWNISWGLADKQAVSAIETLRKAFRETTKKHNEQYHQLVTQTITTESIVHEPIEEIVENEISDETVVIETLTVQAIIMSESLFIPLKKNEKQQVNILFHAISLTEIKSWSSISSPEVVQEIQNNYETVVKNYKEIISILWKQKHTDVQADYIAKSTNILEALTVKFNNTKKSPHQFRAIEQKDNSYKKMNTVRENIQLLVQFN